MDFTETQFQTLTLEKVQRAMRITLARSMVKNVSIETVTDLASRTLSATLIADLLGNKISVERDTYSHPDGWWQAFKEAQFPAWLRRRMPVRMRDVTVTTTFMHVCPHLNIQSSNDQNVHLRFMMPPDQLARMVPDDPAP